MTSSKFRKPGAPRKKGTGSAYRHKRTATVGPSTAKAARRSKAKVARTSRRRTR